VFWVISVYFNIRNTLPKSGTFLLGHPVCIYIYTHTHTQSMASSEFYSISAIMASRKKIVFLKKLIGKGQLEDEESDGK